MCVNPGASVLSVARGDGVVQLIALTKKVSTAEPHSLPRCASVRAWAWAWASVYMNVCLCAWRVHTWWLGRAHTVGNAKAAIIADARSVHSEAELRLCRVRMLSVRRMQPP